MSDVIIPEVPGTLLLAGVGGSTAYGLAHAGSDKDLLGTYATPTPQVLGLRGRQLVDATVVRKAPDPDAAIHELGKLATLAAKCNPTVSELLWLEDYVHTTALGLLLVEIREAFLSTPAVRSAYGGYAISQVQRVQRGMDDKDPRRVMKLGRHALRLLYQGTDLLRTGTLTVNCAERREELFAAGELALHAPEEFADMFTAHVAEFDATESVLPDEPDLETVEFAVRHIRLSLLHAAA